MPKGIRDEQKYWEMVRTVRVVIQLPLLVGAIVLLLPRIAPDHRIHNPFGSWVMSILTFGGFGFWIAIYTIMKLRRKLGLPTQEWPSEDLRQLTRDILPHWRNSRR